MALVNFSDYCYVPLIWTKPSEMKALEELPSDDKDALLPFIVLQPWVGSHEFVRTSARLEAAFQQRPLIADLTNDPFLVRERRPVHDFIDELRNPNNGFERWYDFVGDHVNYIPTLQLSHPNQISHQRPHLEALNRGVVIRLTEQMIEYAGDIATLFEGWSGNDVYFIIDFERQSRDLLIRATYACGVAEQIRAIIPDCYISFSASSFPDSFTGLIAQDIFERRFHELIVADLGPDRVIYSDRASVKAERQQGGGGAPSPRIDNALPTSWEFFREPDLEDRPEAFRAAAVRAIASPNWADLGIWGTDRIRQTAEGVQEEAITSTQRAISARINIHIHRQLGAPGGQAEEIEWID